MKCGWKHETYSFPELLITRIESDVTQHDRRGNTEAQGQTIESVQCEAGFIITGKPPPLQPNEMWHVIRNWVNNDADADDD